MASNGWSRARNLLCVRLDSLGDLLMTVPALRALKEAVHGRSVTVLTSSAGAAAARLVPEIDSVMIYEAPWVKASAVHQDVNGEIDMAAALRAQRFDAAVIFTVYSQNPLPSALLCHLADIPLRLAHCRENPYQLLTDWVPETEPDTAIRHEVRRQLDLVAHVGAVGGHERLSLRVTPSANARAVHVLSRAGVDTTRPWLVLHPGASAPSRRYPGDRFATVAHRLAVEDAWQVVFTGTAAEADAIAAIQELVPVKTYSLAGQMDLLTFAALLARAPVLISNNTGPVHVACAVGTPVVDLYALTNPQHTPWSVPHRVLNQDVPCKYCYKSVCPQRHHACLRNVTPEQVLAAVRSLLAETAAARVGLSGTG